MSPLITRRHTQRLRQMYRSAGWPMLDVLEAELLAAGLLERERGAFGGETLRVTDAGVAAISQSAVRRRGALSSHEALVGRVTGEMTRAGRIAWRGLSVRVPLPYQFDEKEAVAPAHQAQAALINEAPEAKAGPRTLAHRLPRCLFGAPHQRGGVSGTGGARDQGQPR
ncbi:hypothetical protein [Ottowia testudinis]|uniref:hypothetical protein n=1 Tax=Ottowia testudinis TaxID=2816950 RepID=UPI00326306CE